MWPTVDLLLEAFVFAYMGLQLKFVIEDVRADGLPVLHIFAYALLILAFVVAVGTLSIQGLTLPYLIRRLDVADPHEKQQNDEQWALARTISRTAAETYMRGAAREGLPGVRQESVDAVLERVRRSVRARMDADETEDHEERAAAAGALFDALRRNVLVAQRAALVQARDSGELDDEVLRDVLDGLDVEEAAAEARIDRRSR
ncbi:hypothetical protein BJI47_09930 [Rhodococcus sp. 1168]|nr:hypothetical protein BJI47_09930 [Rhodococcus sp. 1168]